MHAWPAPDVPSLPGQRAPAAAARHRAPARCVPTAPGAGRRASTSAASPRTTRPTWATPPPTSPSTSCSACGATPATTVHYVQNVTDVDDPLLERARSRPATTGRRSPTARPQLFREDMTALRVLPPRRLRRRGRVDPGGRRRCVERLQAAGAVYRVDGDLYFRRARPTRALRRGRGAVDERRCSRSSPSAAATRTARASEHPLDCLLWQRERPGEPAWDCAARPRPARLAHRVRRHRAATTSARRSTSRAAARDLVVPAPRDGRAPRRRSPTGTGRSPGTTCTPAWSVSTARR